MKPTSKLTDQAVKAFSDKSSDADIAVLLINGNAHNIVGLLEISSTHDAKLKLEDVEHDLNLWLDQLAGKFTKRMLLLLPPPPIESESQIKKFPGAYAEKIKEFPIRSSAERLSLWRHSCSIIRKIAASKNLEVISLPAEVFSQTGFMAEDCYGRDPTHGNAEYGTRVIAAIFDYLKISPSLKIMKNSGRKPISANFYSSLPNYAFWKQSIGQVERSDVDPVTSPRFQIAATDKVATAGSCFAQHISKRLRKGGFSFLVTEQPDQSDGADAEARGFYDFSARYGNIYTPRQLLQLFDRAFGYFKPLDRTWRRSDGSFCDPFRPRIEPDGYSDRKSVFVDSVKHLAAVKAMFEELDIFVFTLGLTECWGSRLDGAVYPIAPGVAGGAYDPTRHELLNFRVRDVVLDLQLFVDKLRLVNRRAKVILTVSPVPLVATAVDRHVLVSTTYSKSVLRVAADEIRASNFNVEYFPSYEIVTGPHAGGEYFDSDRRSVTQEGVDHVMRVFMSRMTKAGGSRSNAFASPRADEALAWSEMEELAEVACDEELLSRERDSGVAIRRAPNVSTEVERLANKRKPRKKITQ